MTEAFPALANAGLTLEQRADVLAAVIDSSLDAVISMDSAGKVLEWRGAAARIFGWTRDEAMGKPLDSLVVPPDLVERHRAALAHRRATGTEDEVALRTEVDALDRDGRRFPVELSITHVPYPGAHYYTARVRDISQQRADAAQREVDANRILLLNRELYHRSGNDFAVALALVRRSKTAVDAERRVEALGRTLAIVRAAGSVPVDLVDLARTEAAPYVPALSATGPSVMLRAGPAQTLGLCIHEMATNAMQHGPLLRRTRWWRRQGRVVFTWRINGAELVMDWAETGGPPPVPREKRGRGFGSILIKDGLEHNLGGTMTRDYRRTGLVAQTRIPMDRLM